MFQTKVSTPAAPAASQKSIQDLASWFDARFAQALACYSCFFSVKIPLHVFIAMGFYKQLSRCMPNHTVHDRHYHSSFCEINSKLVYTPVANSKPGCGMMH